MAQFLTNEGASILAQMLFVNSNDAQIRPTSGLMLVLFTNPTVDATTTYEQLVQPAGGGYVPINIPDNSWVVNNGTFTQPSQTFIPSTGGYTGNIAGCALCTTGIGATHLGAKTLFIATDPAAPVTLAAGVPYVVSMNIACDPTTKGSLTLALDLLLNNFTNERGSTLQCVLFTNAAQYANAQTLADLTQPTNAGGYAPVLLGDGSWILRQNPNGGTTVTFPSTISFTPVITQFSSPIVGYAIATTRAPYYIVAIELDPTAGGVSIPINKTYAIVPTVNIL